MAIVVGTRVDDVDFTSIVGDYASNIAFPNSLSATNALNALYGVGYGDRGLGQVPYTYTSSGNGTQTIFDIGITTSLRSLTATVTSNNVINTVKIVSILGSVVTLAAAPAAGTTVKIYVHLISPAVDDMIYASTWRFMRDGILTLNKLLQLSSQNIPLPLSYKVKLTSTSGDPLQGYLLYDNVSQADSKFINISKYQIVNPPPSPTYSDQTWLYQILVSGFSFTISKDNIHQTITIDPNSTLIDAGTYYTMPVSYITTTGSFTNDDSVKVTAFETGDTVHAWSYNWATAVRQIEQNRKNIPPSSFPLSPTTQITQQRTTLWPNLVQCIFQVDFQDEDHARYFFNSGGYITVTPDFIPTDPTDAHSASWRTLLKGTSPSSTTFAGSFSIKAEASVRSSGQGGNFQSNIGYYTLTSQSQQIQYFTVGNLDESLINNTGIYRDYTANYYTTSVRVANVNQTNGGNGKTLIVELLFNDVYGTSYQPVNGTLTVVVSMTKANDLTIEDPTFTVTTDLIQGGGEIYYPFNTEITANKYNYNLLTEALAAGYPNTAGLPLKAVVTIKENIIVGSTSTATYAMTIPALQANSSVIIRNNGYIVGKGGAGGIGTAHVIGGNGTSGGHALLLQHSCTLENNGIIGGGGGGGGGASATDIPQTGDDTGGGGGGGAGFDLGNGADGAPYYGTYTGQNGTLNEGGVGGTPSARVGSPEGWQAGNGGKGGNLGQAGSSGQNGYNNDGFDGGTGGVAGNAITGQTHIATGSNLGQILGNII